MPDFMTILQIEIDHWTQVLEDCDKSPIKRAVERTEAVGAIKALGRIVEGLKGKRA